MLGLYNKSTEADGPNDFQADVDVGCAEFSETYEKTNKKAHWHKAKGRLAKAHQRIANKRRDAHGKLAHELCATKKKNELRIHGTRKRNAHPDGRRYAPWEPQMMLERHSYQGALCDADTMEQYQYLEGCRRDIPNCDKVSAVSNAAEWIARITYTNFPEATQIVDWFHAAERLWAVGKACSPDQEDRKVWVQARLDELWSGQVDKLVTTLQVLNLTQSAKDEDVSQTPGCFNRQKERMLYHQYRVAGYPIGSGTVESGVNIVVHHRLKRQGRGWKRTNAQSMLAGLSELHSKRFTWAWRRSQTTS